VGQTKARSDVTCVTLREMASPGAMRATATPAAPVGHRWLVFIHQLPARPSNARVKTWRRLQQIGAVLVKNAVHVLPNTVQAREDFEWLRLEVIDMGGQASVLEASSIPGEDERRMLTRFRPAAAVEVLTPRKATARGSTSAGSLLDARDYQRRTWVTRPRPGVDRFASAWLIRRFIDPAARFVFAGAPDKAPDAIPFDMYQPIGFRHEGDRCTFEVLQARFGLRDRCVTRIAEIVHDVDLKDDRFQSPHMATIRNLVEGLRASIPDDDQLLAEGMMLFEALYASFQTGKRPKGGRARIC
jgi:hypothetical protein